MIQYLPTLVLELITQHLPLIDILSFRLVNKLTFEICETVHFTKPNLFNSIVLFRRCFEPAKIITNDYHSLTIFSNLFGEFYLLLDKQSTRILIKFGDGMFDLGYNYSLSDVLKIHHSRTYLIPVHSIVFDSFVACCRYTPHPDSCDLEFAIILKKHQTIELKLGTESRTFINYLSWFTRFDFPKDIIHFPLLMLSEKFNFYYVLTYITRRILQRYDHNGKMIESFVINFGQNDTIVDDIHVIKYRSVVIKLRNSMTKILIIVFPIGTSTSSTIFYELTISSPTPNERFYFRDTDTTLNENRIYFSVFEIQSDLCWITNKSIHHVCYFDLIDEKVKYVDSLDAIQDRFEHLTFFDQETIFYNKLKRLNYYQSNNPSYISLVHNSFLKNISILKESATKQ